MSTTAKGKAQPYPITDRSDFKAWVLQYPNAHKLLREIIFRWRGSNIKARGARGLWAVYSRDQWAEWAELSIDQTKRALRILEIDGLVIRERHKFTGRGVWLYLQPTKKALIFASNRPQDLARLDGNQTPDDAHVGAPLNDPDGAPVSAPNSTPDGAPAYTLPFPFSPTVPSSPTIQQASAHTCAKGKGMAGEGGKVKKVLKIVSSSPKPSPTPQSPPPPADDDEDAIDAMFAASKAKKLAKLDKAFPILKGKHEKHVKHPSQKWENWSSFSPELQAQIYAKYETYVANWYKGKKGKPYTQFDDWTDKDEADFKAAMDALEFDD